MTTTISATVPANARDISADMSTVSAYTFTFDLSTLDPLTFDLSTLDPLTFDLSTLDPLTFDLAKLDTVD